MNPEALAELANLGVATATVALAIGWLLHLAEWAAAWAAARSAQLVRVGAPASASAEEPTRATATTEQRADRLARAGLAATVLGTAMLAAAVLARGLAAGRAPWGNMYEFAVAGALVVLVVYLGLVARAGIGWLAPIVTGFAVVVLGLSILVYLPPGPLVPALDSYWLVLHVAAAAIAGGAFVVGAGAAALFLVKDRAEARAGGPVTTGVLGRLPTTAAMDRLGFQVHAFAFPLWTFAALISGPIWAQHAWGRYWGWDPKEVWAFITWVVYAGYLHARATAGWRGRGAAVLALVGFVTFLFNFVGINLFVSGLHSYAF
ncbi:MAG: c-type cytochrome biogenesis protein CcsB [Actinomycetota bacterium]|nr:c-type cytochrome biogenesis protein CcsB [Actinomycetota bacterium]